MGRLNQGKQEIKITKSNTKTRVVVETQGVKAEGSGSKGQPWLHSKLEVSLSYKKIFLKNKGKRKTVEPM